MLINKTEPFAYLEGILNDGSPWLVPINRNPFIIGRSEKCDFTLLSNTISRKHAEIYINGPNLFVKDNNSLNGTYVNGERISDKIALSHEDSIHFGDMKFKFFEAEFIKNSNADGTVLFESPQKTNDFIHFHKITKREEQVVYHLLQGKSTKSIADILDISKGTAKNHILNIFKKTGIHSRFELLAVYNNFKFNKN